MKLEARISSFDFCPVPEATAGDFRLNIFEEATLHGAVECRFHLFLTFRRGQSPLDTPILVGIEN